MTTRQKSKLLHIIALFIGLWLLWIFAPAWGQDDNACQAGHDCGGSTDGATVTTDTLVNITGSRNRSFGLANAQGDVDIGDCIVTKQWNAVVLARQSWEYNAWCMAANIHNGGKPIEAAMLRCTIPMIIDTFGVSCINAMTFGFAPDTDDTDETDVGEVLVGSIPEMQFDEDEEDDTRYAEVIQQLAVLQEAQVQVQVQTPQVNAELRALREQEAKRTVKEAESRAFFRSKYEASIAIQIGESSDET